MNILAARAQSPTIRRTAWRGETCNLDVDSDKRSFLTVEDVFADDWVPVYPDAMDFLAAI